MSTTIFSHVRLRLSHFYDLRSLLKVINCDKLAHELYEKGTVLATDIAATFGDHIVQNGVVDRKKLGAIVFADKVSLSSIFLVLIKVSKSLTLHWESRSSDSRKVILYLVTFQKKLRMLNDIVWPPLKNKVEEAIAQSKAEFVIVDAAVLLDANWDNNGIVHQVWSCIIPPTVAKERIVERDHITNEEVIF